MKKAMLGGETIPLWKRDVFTPFIKGGRFAKANRGDFSTAQLSRLLRTLGRALDLKPASYTLHSLFILHNPATEKSPRLPYGQPTPFIKGGKPR